MMRKRFFVDAVSNEHCHRSRCARSGRKQVSRSKRNRTIYRNTSDRAFQRDFSSSRICLCFFFAYTIYSRIERTGMLAIIPSAMSRTRVMFSNLFLDRSYDYPLYSLLVLAYSGFRNFLLSNSLFSFLSFSLFFPASTNIHYPRVPHG